jgi:hypothetical protein
LTCMSSVLLRSMDERSAVVGDGRAERFAVGAVTRG